MLGHSPLVSFQYTEQTEVWISLSFSSAIIQPIWKVEMITQWSLVDTSHWSLRQLSSSIIILAVQIRNIDYPRNSWISPIKAINFEMTVLKTKQFNGIQFGSVRPHFFDYNQSCIADQNWSQVHRSDQIFWWTWKKDQDQVHRHIWPWSFFPAHNDLMWT